MASWRGYSLSSLSKTFVLSQSIVWPVVEKCSAAAESLRRGARDLFVEIEVTHFYLKKVEYPLGQPFSKGNTLWKSVAWKKEKKSIDSIIFLYFFFVFLLLLLLFFFWLPGIVDMLYVLFSWLDSILDEVIPGWDYHSISLPSLLQSPEISYKTRMLNNGRTHSIRTAQRLVVFLWIRFHLCGSCGWRKRLDPVFKIAKKTLWWFWIHNKHNIVTANQKSVPETYN